MTEGARPVESRQTGPHPRLLEVVDRHVRAPSRRPIADHTQRAWRALQQVLAEDPLRPIVLDAGCGTGSSTHRLADRHPAAWVLGVDQSAHRLRWGGEPIRRTGRVLLARAELGDLYRLMARAGVRLGAHFLLYPNPWPKAAQLRRRWHAHPAFPAMLALGGRLEARSNWLVYLEELAAAIRRVTGAGAAPTRLAPRGVRMLTPFERKYARSGHELFRLALTLPPVDHWVGRGPWGEVKPAGAGPA